MDKTDEKILQRIKSLKANDSLLACWRAGQISVSSISQLRAVLADISQSCLESCIEELELGRGTLSNIEKVPHLLALGELKLKRNLRKARAAKFPHVDAMAPEQCILMVNDALIAPIVGSIENHKG